MASITERSGAWLVRVRRKGYPTQTATFDTKGQAQRWAREVESKMDNRRFTAISKASERATLSELLDRYQREVTARKRADGSEGRKIKQLKAHPLAQRLLFSIKPGDIAALRDELEDAGKAANTVRLYLAILSNLYNVARREWGFAAIENPCKLVKKPSTTGTERDRRLREGELELLREHAAPWLVPLIELAIETAMRRSEIAGLHWHQIDMAGGVIRLDRTKNGERRAVPMTPHAKSILQGLFDQAAGKVAGAVPIREITPSGRIVSQHVDELSREFHQATVRAGITDLRFHDLRHEATSRLFEKGLNIMEVATITGHKTLSQLKRYTHPRTADLVRKLAA